MGKRIAVLFGNNYAKYPENALRGCHNDVENMAHELLTAGMFREDEIVKYLDGGRESPENTILFTRIMWDTHTQSISTWLPWTALKYRRIT